ncbi:hypothetical protein BKA58DRAFT_125150 [Alternaria rosae]|uniref:uncharacterized protein n=1 Tax=Alternaria rosae TaxID=1187941 RepID=UPI001E8CBCC3|nr:uncharacterized protein BKA58DRAFT_125150 [Alternaria rosae]KAH6875615.1 hypothetical protein BKA58DRAFT_125150 [Alternaria rosae]
MVIFSLWLSKMEAFLLYLLVLNLVTMASAQFLDTTLVVSSSSALDSSVFAGLSSQFNGQQSVFITITRPSTTTTTSSSSLSSSPPPEFSSAIPSPTAVPTESPSPPNPTSALPPSSGGSPTGFSTGYTVGTAVGGSVGGLLIISLLFFWFRAHKKKKLRLSISSGSAPSNKLGEKVTEVTKTDVVPKRKPLSTNPTASGTGTGTHVRKLDGGRTLKSTNTL